MRQLFASLGTAVALAAAILIIAVPATLSSSATADETGGQRHIVEIRNLEFSPPVLEVSPGDTVVWINKDIVPHTATADDASWDSDFIDTKGQWQVVVSDDMLETYFCAYHPTMTGRLVVVDR